MGITEDKEGNLLEGATATVGVLLKSGSFVVPPSEDILEGTTINKIIAFLQKEVIPNKENNFPLLSKQVLTVERRKIKIKECLD